MVLPYWKVDNLTLNILLSGFFLSIITLLDYQDVFSLGNPCFEKKTKTLSYIGRSCSYGESILILQRKNKALSFIFPCLMIMKTKLMRELLMKWVLVNFDKYLKKDDLEDEWTKCDEREWLVRPGNRLTIDLYSDTSSAVKGLSSSPEVILVRWMPSIDVFVHI